MCFTKRLWALWKEEVYLENAKNLLLSEERLSLSMNFKYLVSWGKLSALEREDEKDSWSEKDSPSGSPGWL